MATPTTRYTDKRNILYIFYNLQVMAAAAAAAVVAVVIVFQRCYMRNK